jgi:hypothetical protein
MKTKTCFRALYSFPGFQARARFKSGVTGDPHARVVALVRRQKKVSALGVGGDPLRSMTAGPTASVIWTAEVPGSFWTSSIDGYPARSAG